MSDQQEFHIILLPSGNYWGWVSAVRDYAMHFGASITPMPENARKFHEPDQIVTIVGVADGYPDQGNIRAWFSQESPQVALDYIAVATPDELQTILKARISSNLRYGQEARPVVAQAQPSAFKLVWPVDSQLVTQEFAENPDIYSRFGLPGHEGIDFHAPLNSNIYAGADGDVYMVHDGREAHPYGIHIRIKHDGGFSTVYAHLNQALVHSGQQVKAGDVIGLADSTGNSTGHHLHLTLKKDGASAAGETIFRNDIVDPMPYLIFPEGREKPKPKSSLWPIGRTLVGLHGRIGGSMEEKDWEQVVNARVSALKLLSTTSVMDVDRARQINPDMFLLVRLVDDFSKRTVTSKDFAANVEHRLRQFYDKGVRYFEIHNEPNLTPEGLGLSWKDGLEFGEWFLEVLGRLRPKFPEAKFGWPGLSPGPAIPGMRVSQADFLNRAGHLPLQADWIGCHCVWDSEASLADRSGGLNYQFYREQWSTKLIFITKFTNSASTIDDTAKANQYLKYLQQLDRSSGVGASFAFLVSAAGTYSVEAWRGEDGKVKPFAGVIGARRF